MKWYWIVLIILAAVTVGVLISKMIKPKVKLTEVDNKIKQVKCTGQMPSFTNPGPDKTWICTNQGYQLVSREALTRGDYGFIE